MTTGGSKTDARWLALVVLCAGMLMIVLDQTIVNVALPAIEEDLRFGQAGLAWVVNAYLIAYGGLLLLAGRLGDLIGHKKVFLIGLGVFTLASLLCGLAVSSEMLIVSRFVQGAGGALATSVTLGMVVTMFPEPDEQRRAIGVFSFVAAAGASIGLLLGGVLTDAMSWHWIFFVNIPIGIVAAVAAVRLVPDSAGLGLREGADVLGALLIVAAVMLGVYTIVKAEHYGFGSAHTLGLGAVALALLAGFVLRQRTARKPLLPLRVFRSRNVSGANLVQISMVAGMFGLFFLGTLYMQLVLQYTPLQIGLAFMPVAVAIAVFSVSLSARLNARFGERNMLILGLSLMLVGMLVFTQVPVDGSYVAHILPAVAPIGIGMGLSFPALMTLAMSGAAHDEAGLASGLVNTTAQVGGALGLAVLATTSTTYTSSLLASGVGRLEALTSGFHLAFWISAVLVAVALVLAVFVLRQVAVSRDAKPVLVH
ncbi:DHA2 family efflux MFS transporter permease subunit [Lentzea jiangxiensis]|uniref:Drug resistance transporter, EmrB/QacA subfamily n=1 Tax=Lentzea jiangxiensis TaxID=641025 RepID=A0A1H0TJQ8_9PSEU|nr:DHA2 family efflux MFS transporter permease subunit [Lentzea jiangxiensis]SDP54055.1 drug resistance transporter, EmrB/QacA subfamily [Lentzea jiangxiensis]